MGQSADQIRQEIDQKRADASSKIDQLQQQVQGTTEQVRDQVQESVEQVVEQVKGTVDDTLQTVKQSVDFHKQIEERPLVALGAALVGGFLLGGMTGGNGGGQSQQQGSGSSNEYRSTSSHGSGSSTVRTALQKSGLEDTISNAAAALMGSVTDQLKSTLDRNFPGFADKMQTAQNKTGSLADKTHETQKTS